VRPTAPPSEHSTRLKRQFLNPAQETGLNEGFFKPAHASETTYGRLTNHQKVLTKLPHF